MNPAVIALKLTLAVVSLLFLLSLTTSCAPRYPPHWWTPVPKNGAPAWEILPQEARPGEVILSKRNELGLLSNFAATPFTFRGQRYASLEGIWRYFEILTRIRSDLQAGRDPS